MMLTHWLIHGYPVEMDDLSSDQSIYRSISMIPSIFWPLAIFWGKICAYYYNILYILYIYACIDEYVRSWYDDMLLAHAKQLKDAQTNCASWVVLLRRYFEKAIHNEDDLLTTLKPQLPSSILIDLYTYTMVASGYVIVVYSFDFLFMNLIEI